MLTKVYRIVVGNVTQWYHDNGKKYDSYAAAEKAAEYLQLCGDPATVVECIEEDMDESCRSAGS